MNLKKYLDLNLVSKIIELLICVSIVVVSIKKGGFYTKDTLFFNIFTCIIGIIYILLNINKYNNSKLDNKYVNYVDIAFLLLPFAYLLPIIFLKTISPGESTFEMLRYINIAVIYFVVRLSDNKRYYINAVLAVGLMQSVIGIDGLGQRYLMPYLNKLSSGYLKIDLDRLSGTIQYANTLAMIVAVCATIVLDKLFKELVNLKSKVNLDLSQYIKSALLYIALFLYISTMILTGSRAVLMIYILILSIYIIKNKHQSRLLGYILFLLFLEVFIYSIIMNKYILINGLNIYCIFVLFMFISLLLGYMISKIYTDDMLNGKYANILNINKKKKIYILFLIGLIYAVLAINVTGKLSITSNEKVDIKKREIYNLSKNNVNNIEIKIDESSKDTQYFIELFEEDYDFNLTCLAKFDSTTIDTTQFSYIFTPNENTKRLVMNISCAKGSIAIDSLKLNSKEVPLEYILIPSEYVFRFKNILYGSSSIRDRVEYIKDSIKLIKMSPIIGLGGEGFKNTYKEVQTIKYVSSEAHNSFLQIFVESGIIGGTIVLIIIGATLFVSKYSPLKLAFILLLIHSLVDLNFSYMISLVIFTCFVAILVEKENGIN